LFNKSISPMGAATCRAPGGVPRGRTNHTDTSRIERASATEQPRVGTRLIRQFEIDKKLQARMCNNTWCVQLRPPSASSRQRRLPGPQQDRAHVGRPPQDPVLERDSEPPKPRVDQRGPHQRHEHDGPPDHRPKPLRGGAPPGGRRQRRRSSPQGGLRRLDGALAKLAAAAEALGAVALACAWRRRESSVAALSLPS